MFLESFPYVQTGNLSDAEAEVDRNAMGSTFTLADKGGNFQLEVNVAQLKDVTLVAAGCDTACTFVWSPADYMRQMFQVTGRSQISFDGNCWPSADSLLVPAGSVVKMENDPNYQSLTLRIAPDALKSKLSALLGDDVDSPQFDYSPSKNTLELNSLRLATWQLVREIDQVGVRLSAPVLVEMEQILLVKFLLSNRHNYSAKLYRQSGSPSKKQLKLIENYIADHWDEPLDLERLSKTFDIAGRSIFRLFARERGDSPAKLLRKIRLDKARSMLLGGLPGTTVIEVAKTCGFQSFGHFARAYRQSFGELPLETLRMNRRSS